MNTATFVRRLDGFQGSAILVRLDPHMSTDYDEDGEDTSFTEYAVVSAVDVPFSGPETLIFAADADGNVTSYLDLPGSFRGDQDHTEALRRAGYTLVL